MTNGRDKKSASSPLIHQPRTNRFEPANTPEVEFKQIIEAALALGDDAHALDILDAAPSWMKKQPEFLLARASVFLSLGDLQSTLKTLHEVERKNPRYLSVYITLAMLYMDLDWPAHALQCAKRAESIRDLDNESRASLELMIKESTSFIQLYASELQLPFETMRRALILNEQAQMAMDDNRLSEAEHFCKEAIKIAPQWNPPHNNRAKTLYYLGRVEEAITVSAEVLSREPENIFALESLTTYHVGLNRPELAREYAGRLKKLIKKIPAEGMEIEYVISALALVEDTPALWEIASKYINAPSDSLFSRSWLCLTVAAIRSGKWKNALKLIKKADEVELSPAGYDLLEELRTTANQRQPRLAWMPPAYPGVDLFFHPKIMAEWDSLVRKFASPLSPVQKRKLNNFFQKYPFLVTALKRTVWEEDGHSFALQVLGDMESPEAEAEILRFALSQTGSQGARMEALMKLVRNDRYIGPKTIKFWNEDLEEWRVVDLNMQRIGDIEPNAKPETIALIEKARKSKDPAESIALLQKAVEKEPASPIAVFNLGVMLTQNGNEKEGNALIYRSVEIDPNYTFGHALIALSAAQNRQEQEALDHLEIVTQADVIAPDTAILANIAWFLLAIHENDLKSARQRLEIAIHINPEHRLVKHYKNVLKEAESIDKGYGRILEFQRKSAQRAHLKLLKTPLSKDMALIACLETNTKEMLVGSAHFLKVSTVGKKQQLANRLAEVLLDPEFLQSLLNEDFTEKECQALQWLLEAEGARPWIEFMRKFGSDQDESVYWDYHEPQSIPGRLRRSGLFYTGILEGVPAAFIPADARPLLHKLLSRANGQRDVSR